MLLGCCTIEVDRARAAAASGADYIEVGLSAVMAMGDDEFEEWATALGSAGVRVHAANGFMPASIRVVGPDVDREQVRAYVAGAGQRLERLGARVAVFGSSGSRQVPDAFDPATARAQLAEFLQEAAETLGAHGVTLALEPLCAEESNLVNTVGDGLRLVRDAAPAARVLADCFHMQREGESLDVLAEAGDMLAHAHVSSSARRGVGAGDHDARAFVQRLRDLGYSGGVSLECGWDDFGAEIGPSIGALRTWSAR